MKFSIFIALALGSALTAKALIIPEDLRGLSLADDTFDRRDPLYANLERRKGGGGGGAGGGGHAGGSSAAGHSVGATSAGSKGGSSDSSGDSSSGNRGGTSGSSTGTGVRPSYGGRGSYYGGGATTPYASGLRSPGGLIAGGLLTVAAVGLLFHGPWLYPVYYYPYTEPYTFYNASLGANQTEPVQCLCEQYEECGCDENTDPTYLSSVLGNGSIAALNDTLVQVSIVNGTSTILINGTLPNGTTSADPNATGTAPSAATSTGTAFTGGSTSAAARQISGKAMGVIGWVVVSSAVGCALMAL